MSTSTTKERSVYIDILKAIAIFMMIAVHCTDNVTPAERSEPWYNLWGSIYGSLMRPSIPLFVMVTGILLLPVKIEITEFYKKRLLRLVSPFIIWSVLYNLFPWITGLLGLNPSVINDFFAWVEPSQQLGDALHNIAMIPLTFSYFAVQMWYIYLLIGIYLYMPFFSAWVKQSTKKEQHIFLILWFVSLFIPYLRQFAVLDLWGVCSWNEFGMLYSFAGFNGYLLLGYYLNNNPLKWSTSKMLLVFVPMFIVGYCTTFFGVKTITA
ncbi:MAG: acyltransferase, partial [Rikenellaceae bacterium]